MEARDNWKSGLGLAAACDTLPFWKCKRKKTKSECIKRLHTDLENICMLEQKEKKKCAHPAGHTLYQGCHYLLSYKYVLFDIKLKVLHNVKLLSRKLITFSGNRWHILVSWSCPLVKRDTQKGHSKCAEVPINSDLHKS